MYLLQQKFIFDCRTPCQLQLASYVLKHASRSLSHMKFCTYVYFRQISSPCDKPWYISLGQSFHIHVWAFRLAACVIRLTMLQQFTTFGRRPGEEACKEWHVKSESMHVVYRQSSCVKLFCHVTIHYEGLCLRHTKMNETTVKSFCVKSFACRNGGEKNRETR